MDKSLPPSLARTFEDYKLYDELTRAERKLDWTVARKRAELQDSLSRSHTVMNSDL
jgi:SWI/SNF-related matrix-associated actin-dependent regulator of chromatin subfamily D